MPLATPQSIISLSLRAAGILGVGQTALAEDNSDTFNVLNGMIAQWNIKRWLIYHLLDVSVPTTGAMSYSVGPGGDFDVPRVDRLEAAFFRQFVSGLPGQTYVDYPLDILQSREDYNRVALKSLRSWPEAIFFDAGNPTGSVYPVPIPLQNGTFELHLTIKEHLPQFTSLVQQINLPDEYTEALWTNLVIRICAIYPGAELTPHVVGLAKASLSAIRTANTQIPRLQMPAGLVRPPLYNIYSGTTY
jgi:hypothetical protein